MKTSRAFRWLEPPDPKALQNAEQLLGDLGAIEAGKLTSLGQRMLAFPVHPRYARMLLAAQEQRCVRGIALVAALTQGRNLLRRAQGREMRDEREDFLGGEDESDLFILLRAFRFAERNHFDPRRCSRLGVNAGAAREAGQLWEQFLSIARAEGLDIAEHEAEPGAIARCVLAGFPDQVAARLDEGTFDAHWFTIAVGVLARESVVHRARLLTASEIREIESSDGERQVLLTLATAIKEEWLREFFPEAVNEITKSPTTLHSAAWSDVRSLSSMTLFSRKRNRSASQHGAATILAREVKAGNCPLKHWDHSIEQCIARLNFVAAASPDSKLPPIGEAVRALLIEQICQGATSYKEIKERPVLPVLKSWLSAGQQSALDQFAPERIKLPNDRNARITYGATHAPTIAARIQDLYGVENGLTIGQRRMRVADRGARAEPSSDSDHRRSGHFLARKLSQDQAGVAAQISEAPLALEPFG